jgi:hypothetical protein
MGSKNATSTWFPDLARQKLTTSQADRSMNGSGGLVFDRLRVKAIVPILQERD